MIFGPAAGEAHAVGTVSTAVAVVAKLANGDVSGAVESAGDYLTGKVLSRALNADPSQQTEEDKFGNDAEAEMMTGKNPCKE